MITAFLFVACMVNIGLASVEVPEGVIMTEIKKNASSIVSNSKSKRAADSLPIKLDNLIDFYSLDIKVGSPAQNVSVLLDTGSSDLWVYSPGQASDPTIPTFNSRRSTSWRSFNVPFRIRYMLGEASGVWGSDTVQLENAKLPNQNFAVVNRGDSLDGVPGVMGIGLRQLESSGLFGIAGYYDNVPASLYRQGHIASPTFSLFLDDVNAKSGSIIFGGIDHSRYKGQLSVLRRISNSQYTVRCDSIKVDNHESIGSVAATLDSGTSLGTLPRALIQSLAQQLGLSYNSRQDYYYVSARRPLPNHHVQFSFSGVVYTLPMSKLMVKSDDLGDEFPKGLWILGFQTSNSVLFGDVFLRNFYVVYDTAQPQIAIAEADYQKKTKHITPIQPNTPFTNLGAHSLDRIVPADEQYI